MPLNIETLIQHLDAIGSEEDSPDILFISIGGKDGGEFQRFPLFFYRMLKEHPGKKVFSMLIDSAYQVDSEALGSHVSQFKKEEDFTYSDSQHLNFKLGIYAVLLPQVVMTPVIAAFRKAFDRLLSSGKQVVIADHSINFPGCCSLILVEQYNELKLLHQKNIQYYAQAGSGDTLYLNEHLFFPESSYTTFSRDGILAAICLREKYQKYFMQMPMGAMFYQEHEQLTTEIYRKFREREEIKEVFLGKLGKEEQDLTFEEKVRLQLMIMMRQNDFCIEDAFHKFCLQKGFVSKQLDLNIVLQQDKMSDDEHDSQDCFRLTLNP